MINIGIFHSENLKPFPPPHCTWKASFAARDGWSLQYPTFTLMVTKT